MTLVLVVLYIYSTVAFPYDFGFIPRTKGRDGDPVDVLVLMDEPAFPGVVVKCRLIGIIEGEEYDKKDKERNDRIVAVANDNHSFADIKHIDDLGNLFLRELEEFFVNYHELSAEQYRVIDVRGPGRPESDRRGYSRGSSRIRSGSASETVRPGTEQCILLAT